MLSNAYFISPDNKVISAEITHIRTILRSPEKFGLTSEKIEKIYQKYGEKLGLEGKAREEILLDLMKKGWVRIREYSRQGFWSVQIKKLARKVMDQILSFASKAIAGKLGAKISKYDDMRITSIEPTKGKSVWKFSFNEIAGNVLYGQVYEAEVPEMEDTEQIEQKEVTFCKIEDYEPVVRSTEILEVLEKQT